MHTDGTTDVVLDGSGTLCLNVYNFRIGEGAKYEVTASNGQTQTLNIVVTDVGGRWTSFVVRDEAIEHNVHLPQGCGPFDNDAQFYESNIFNEYQGRVEFEALIGRTLRPTSDRLENGFELVNSLACGDFAEGVNILDGMHETERCQTLYKNAAGDSVSVNTTLTTFSGMTSEQWIISQVHTHSEEGVILQVSLTEITL